MFKSFKEIFGHGENESTSLPEGRRVSDAAIDTFLEFNVCCYREKGSEENSDKYRFWVKRVLDVKNGIESAGDSFLGWGKDDFEVVVEKIRAEDPEIIAELEVPEKRTPPRRAA